MKIAHAAAIFNKKWNLYERKKMVKATLPSFLFKICNSIDVSDVDFLRRQAFFPLGKDCSQFPQKTSILSYTQARMEEVFLFASFYIYRKFISHIILKKQNGFQVNVLT